MRATNSSFGTARTSSNHPSDRERLMPSMAATATSARKFGPIDSARRHVDDEWVDETAPDALECRAADVIGGIEPDEGLHDRARPVVVGLGHDGVRHLFQPSKLPLLLFAAHPQPPPRRSRGRPCCRSSER